MLEAKATPNDSKRDLCCCGMINGTPRCGKRRSETQVRNGIQMPMTKEGRKEGTNAIKIRYVRSRKGVFSFAETMKYMFEKEIRYPALGFDCIGLQVVVVVNRIDII